MVWCIVVNNVYYSIQLHSSITCLLWYEIYIITVCVYLIGILHYTIMCLLIHIGYIISARVYLFDKSIFHFGFYLVHKSHSIQ